MPLEKFMRLLAYQLNGNYPAPDNDSWVEAVDSTPVAPNQLLVVIGKTRLLVTVTLAP